MSPRPYNLGKRQELVTLGRRQVLDAARALLTQASTFTGFTVDAVAKRADVARATVYYQFGSKVGLLEALCDDLAGAGGIAELPEAFANANLVEAWRGFVAAFGRFWDVDRVVMRRLRALGALDADVGTVIAAREARRRQGVEVLVDRLVGGQGSTGGLDRQIALLTTLTSFETFDALARPGQRFAEVAPEVAALGEAVLSQTVLGRAELEPS